MLPEGAMLIRAADWQRADGANDDAVARALQGYGGRMTKALYARIKHAKSAGNDR